VVKALKTIMICTRRTRVRFPVLADLFGHSLISNKNIILNQKPIKNKEKERIENPDKHFNIVLKYTSPRCENISKKIIWMIKKYLPNYNIIFC
jgi:hypothetical protein